MERPATKLVRVPGTYRPQEDTQLLIGHIRRQELARGRRVLDICTGTGALALAAAEGGAATVTAIDLSRRAVANTRLNSLLNRAGVEVLRGDLLAPVAGRLFDLVISNPPYVPAPTERLPRYRMGRCWDGGHDGRVLVDRICDTVGDVLAPGGRFLLTHSAVTDADLTVERLTGRGLEACVVKTETIPFGPVMTRRADLLAARGLIEPRQRHEEIVVIEAVRTADREQDDVVREPDYPDLLAG